MNAYGVQDMQKESKQLILFVRKKCALNQMFIAFKSLWVMEFVMILTIRIFVNLT